MSNRQIRRIAVVVGALLLVALGFVLGTAITPGQATNHAVELRLDESGNQLVTDDEVIFADIYNRVGPSVVSINIATRNAGTDIYIPESLGTGFVIDQEGHIVTNYHVIEGADRIEVNFFDGTITRAEVVGEDPDSDLAVIKVDLARERLLPVTFADSDTLIIGQRALAIGSPFGERWTLTSGIISALDRKIEGLAGFSIGAAIQTDAALNPGNSGGPLLNLQGQVIGVNSQNYSLTGSSSGIGFAVPGNLVQHAASEMIATGSVSYSYIGITGDDINLDIMETYNLPDNLRGVVVSQVRPNTPAADAGLRTSTDSHIDVITAIDDRQITSFSTLIAYLASNTVPGQQVKLTVLRDGQLMNVVLTLSKRP